MKTLIVLVLLFSGTGSQYAPGKMQEVIRVRQTKNMTYSLPERLPDVDGYIALLEPDRIGEALLVCKQNTLDCRRMLVVDCAGHNDGGYQWMLQNNIVLEMDYESAVYWDTVGRGLKVDVYREVINTRLFTEE